MDVTSTVEMRLLAPDGPRPMTVDLHYTSADPYAVRLVFADEDGENVWEVGRRLVTEGLTRVAGHGQVLLCPVPGAGGQVIITLRSPAGAASVTAPIAVLAAFLHDTYTLVPAGTEGDHLDIDTGLAALLAASGDEAA